MSFALTTEAIMNQTKTVTRRLGWHFLKPGDRLWAVDKLRSKNARKLGVIEIVSVKHEPLSAMTDEEFAREGFTPDDLPTPCGTFGIQPPTPAEWFVEMFCRAMKCPLDTPVNRIEFRYVPEGEWRDGR